MRFTALLSGLRGAEKPLLNIIPKQTSQKILPWRKIEDPRDGGGGILLGDPPRYPKNWLPLY